MLSLKNTHKFQRQTERILMDDNALKVKGKNIYTFHGYGSEKVFCLQL